MTETGPNAGFQTGDLLNNTYRIEKLLGRGGTSEVYLARSEVSGRQVAVKALRSELANDSEFLVLMNREEDVREIRHDAVVRYFDNQRTADGLVYLVMDYIEGPGLDVVLRDGPMSVDDLMVLARRVAGGLAAAHEKNIIHRDLSPDNIILRNGDPAEAIIIDFGIARDANPGAETIVGNEFAGKYAYAAPEQLDGKADERADIYAFGAVLLALFRGTAPKIGKNPAEVVRNKALPLDTSGVPEPLRSLIDKMTDPDPKTRLPTASAIVEMLNAGAVARRATLIDDAPTAPSEETVMAPKRKKAAPKTDTSSAEHTKGKTALMLAGLVGVLAVAAVGAWYVTQPPLADPFTLSVVKSGGVPLSATGDMPDQEDLAAFADWVETNRGSWDLRIARGDIPETWGEDALDFAVALSLLHDYRLDISDTNYTVTGLTNSRRDHTTVLQSLAAAAAQSGFSGTDDIELGPRFLSVEAVEDVLSRYADCGPLTLVDAPVDSYGRDTTITVSGQVSSTDTRNQINDALWDIAGYRTITLNTQILSPPVCHVDAALPDVPGAGFEFNFQEGSALGVIQSGEYVVDENPVIDVVIPADVTDGYLYVSHIDVSGNVFHILPNVGWPENSIEVLRQGAQGDVILRVAYPTTTRVPGRLAFTVSADTLGQSRIIALHSTEPLFDELRPTTESAESYADALAERRAEGFGSIRSLDSAIITTREP